MTPKKKIITKENSYRKSVELLKECSTPHGFIASAERKNKYERVWSRDGVICGLAALMSEEKKLIECFRHTLNTLMEYQHELGFIPSNVDFLNKKVSYGGSAGRVDATLWYIIGVSQYFKRTKDKNFLIAHSKSFKKATQLLPFWEFNDKHFLYIPIGGDWADEYINEGYVLYDELLYFRANQEAAYVRKILGSKYKNFERKAKILKDIIEINYWLEPVNLHSEAVYNKVVFHKGIKARMHLKNYLLPYFNPGGYGKRFDSLANILAIHFDAISKQKQKVIIEYINKKFSKRTKNLLPAFWPPIKRGDVEWEKLRNNYSTKFKNKPFHYHNGGLWPFITGFYASAIANTDKKKAEDCLHAINWANYQSKRKSRWGFYEFLSSDDFRTEGMKNQAWSAAGGIMAYQAVTNNQHLFL